MISCALSFLTGNKNHLISQKVSMWDTHKPISAKRNVINLLTIHSMPCIIHWKKKFSLDCICVLRSVEVLFGWIKVLLKSTSDKMKSLHRYISNQKVFSSLGGRMLTNQGNHLWLTDIIHLIDKRSTLWKWSKAMCCLLLPWFWEKDLDLYMIPKVVR